jgi:hypothetical protein
MILAACLFLLVALGLAEQLATARARRAVPIRIHVNGTRGKSTVTRLIAGALREAGIPTVAKTTGTAARLILPDGSEQPIARRGPANIREQAWFLRRAARLGARAVVVECMAIRPDLQLVSERRIIRSTIGVMTNVRLDHTDVMGRSLPEIAASLANTTPEEGPLIWSGGEVGASRASRGAGGAGAVGRAPRPSLAELQNLHTTLEVTRRLGIDDDVALRGMEKAQPDPGAATAGVFTAAGRDVACLDLTAANDPESLDLIASARLKPCPTGADAEQDFSSAHACVYNHRRDRSERLAVFAEHSRVFRQSVAIIITGDRPSLMLMRRVRQGPEKVPDPISGPSPVCRGAGLPAFARERPWRATAWPRRSSARRTRRNGGGQPCAITYVPPPRLRQALDSLAARHASVGTIVFCGNTRGFDVRQAIGDRQA